MQKLKLFIIVMIVSLSCSIGHSQSSAQEGDTVSIKKSKKKKKNKKKKKKYKLPEIDLTHWKVTTPAGDGKKPLEVDPPEIFDYATNEKLIPYMYNDSSKGAIVFHAYPSKATTRNTKYSRSELREQMVSGENNVNWTFPQGGNLKVKMAMDDVSRDENGKYHRVIITQIHGRLTNEQRDLIGEDDNNAPPILKIYWQHGKIRVKTKILKNLNASSEEILHDDAWDDDKGFNFEQEVGFKKFTLEVKVSDGEMVIVLNNQEYKVYDDIHMKKWGVFENYFKVGNYLQTRDEGAFAKVRVYDIEVSH